MSSGHKYQLIFIVALFPFYNLPAFSKFDHKHHLLSISNYRERVKIMLDSINWLFYSHPSLAIMLLNPFVKRKALTPRQASKEAHAQTAEL
jgi:hypothetical protein